MPWTKPVNETETASIENADLNLEFFYSATDAVPPNALTVRLRVRVQRPGKSDDFRGVEATISALPASVLTNAEKTNLLNYLGKLRDAGLSQLGFVFAP